MAGNVWCRHAHSQGMFNHSMVTFGNDNVSFVLHFNTGFALRGEEKEYCSHTIYSKWSGFVSTFHSLVEDF